MNKLVTKTRKKKSTGEDAAHLSPITHPLSLMDALRRLTKDDLTGIRKHLAVAGASSLKKQELCDLLAGRILEMINPLLKRMDEARYAVLKSAAKGEGCAAMQLDPLQARYFACCGLLFEGSLDGTPVLVMPQEVLQAFRQLDKPELQTAIRRNTEWIQLTQGLLHYYGVLTWEQLAEQLAEYRSATDWDSWEYRLVIEESATYHAALQPDKHVVSHIDVVDAEEVRAEQESRPTVPFYRPTKLQVLQASAPDYIDQNAHFRAFVNYLSTHYDVDTEGAEQEVDQLVYGIKLGDAPSELLELLQQTFEFSDEAIVRDMIGLLSRLMNNTRLWFLKGHTPHEVSALSAKQQPAAAAAAAASEGQQAQVYRFDTKRKIGRNDPCPCGSGKKYKKCCGG